MAAPTYEKKAVHFGGGNIGRYVYCLGLFSPLQRHSTTATHPSEALVGTKASNG
jgi:mannitol-1-phosphate/altronate dehydrogenase